MIECVNWSLSQNIDFRTTWPSLEKTLASKRACGVFPSQGYGPLSWYSPKCSTLCLCRSTSASESKEFLKAELRSEPARSVAAIPGWTWTAERSICACAKDQPTASQTPAAVGGASSSLACVPLMSQAPSLSPSFHLVFRKPLLLNFLPFLISILRRGAARTPLPVTGRGSGEPCPSAV
ncbi:hypothetical protein HJG60_011993 [Phyllostomus discolor]|uniref:Uncharacterized protein n=1 Tax=Phyllostomus discolor TaxID=89673 RepID=A0A834DSY8_9CHIR|nr:hypothetical protein HJG60_011993 [Phyllostomus discolor]